MLAAASVFLALVWLVYWYGMIEIASALRDRAMAAAAAHGYAVECAGETGGGFPVSIDIACNRASLAGGAARLSAVVDGLSATAPLYRPGRVEWTATGPLIVDAPTGGIGLTASWTRAETSLDAGLGGLSGIAASLEGLRLHLPPDRRPLPYAGLALSRGRLSLFPLSGDAYRLAADAAALVLQAEDGRPLPEIGLDAEIVALGVGDSLGLDPRRALGDWLRNGATIRIDRLTIAAGTVEASHSGTLALSPEGILSGTLTLRMSGIETLPDIAEAFRPGSRRRVAEIAAAVVAFTRPVEGPGGPRREMTLNIRDNVVSIGIIPIGVIPKLSF